MSEENSSPTLTELACPPLVISGPSGVGKSTLLKRLMEEYQGYFGFSISHTTRKPREGEVHGREYYFIEREEMEKAIKNNEFIETAEFSGNLYGTSVLAVETIAKKGQICILDIDVQGVKQIKFTNLKPRLVFVKPPSLDHLENRLSQRGTETSESLSKRLAASKSELEYGEEPGNFDIVIINDNVDVAYSQLRDFIAPDIAKLEEIRRKFHLGGGDVGAK